MIWENKSKILMINKIYIKQCCLIVWSVKNTESKKSKVVRTINRRIMLLSKWEACDSEIVDKFLLPGDKFMPEMNLRQLGFAYGACV